MQTKIQHRVLGDVTLSKTRRSTRISLSVRPSGEVRLSFPPGVAQTRAVAFLDSKVEWVEASRRRMAVRFAACESQPPHDIEALRKAAKATLPNLVRVVAERFGFRYGNVTIRATRSKWGSCTATNNLSLSLYLMTLPDHLQEYVITHELCHTIHHDHSPRFHALLERCLGGREKALRSELRRYVIR